MDKPATTIVRNTLIGPSGFTIRKLRTAAGNPGPLNKVTFVAGKGLSSDKYSLSKT
ncbi:hypothetical protein GCM10023189_37540 [Nibrella saemangeumensis]|uniref:Uncharacterized protein n=1 Tax=Nibrella saemangeumensis TaxID=1084526 RepID=A0ABP8N5Q9_9BACT